MSRLLLLALIALAATAFGQASKAPTAVEVLRNLEGTFRDVNDFTVDVVGDVNMESIRIPRMTVTMYFKRPDKLHFVSPSFSIVPREGLSPNPDRWRLDYDATMVGRDTLNGRPVWKLQLAAKDPEVRLRQAYLWVDPARWTLARLASMPYGGRTVTFDFEYERVQGRYWLPSKVTALFGSVGEKSEPLFRVPEGSPNPAPQIEEMQRSFRSGFVSFTYQGYRINTGLSDTLFVAADRP
ncbi:MAG: outer membrane lipoprotein-sorting protein [Bacteroidetes bacterium]|jgi:outer membrane lipoprotein-sorting protein|nr:outer membrane lipoprotein-sorting protein [Bacteroidota bacterium]